MAISKKELLERVVRLEKELNNKSREEYFLFSPNYKPTILGKVNAIIEHLGIDIVVTQRATEVKAVKRSKKK